MARTPSPASRYLRSTTLYMGPLQWALCDYYQDATQNTFSDVVRGILTLFAENDSNFDPAHFWEHGVMAAYRRFDGDAMMQQQVVTQCLRWLKRAHKWEPDPSNVPAFEQNELTSEATN